MVLEARGAAFAGRNVVITGGSSGLGGYLAERLWRCGSNVLAASRSVPADRPDASPRLRFIGVDLSSARAAHQLAETIARCFDHVDILINNAGTLNLHRAMSSEGIEYNLAVNYLSHYILTNDLFSLLEKAENPLVANIGSAAANQRVGCSRADFLDAPRKPRFAYERSKWALSAFSFAINDHSRERGSAVRSMLLQPPLMDTRMVRDNAGGRMRGRVALNLLAALGALADPGKVGESALDLLASPGLHAGGYARWSGKGARFEWADRPQWTTDKAAIERLLSASEEMARELLGPSSEARPSFEIGHLTPA